MKDPDSEDPDRVQIHPWISADVKERLDQYCRLEVRTISNAVNLILDRNLPPMITSTREGDREVHRSEC